MQFKRTQDLPPAIKLKPFFDTTKLQNDLSLVGQGPIWPPEEPYRPTFLFASDTKVYHEGKWLGLSLRSQGGAPLRTDPGGPGLDEFRNTLLLEQLHFFRELIESFPGPLRSVRLLRLLPGAVIHEHRDTYHGFEYGLIRIHIPITSNPDVRNVIRGQLCNWSPGEMWYGDFGSLHSVINGGVVDRVHMVIDAVVTPQLLEFFPADTIRELNQVDVLFHEKEISLSCEEIMKLSCRFYMPSTLVRGIFDIDDGITPELASSIVIRNNFIILNVEDKDLFRLNPVGRNRLTFVGWTMERYFEYKLSNDRLTELTLVLRKGSKKTRIAFEVLHD